jgi:positive regulator of sigma E activity
VECFDQDNCDSCGSSFCNVKARTYQAALGPEINVEVGDYVEIHVPPARAIGAGFLVLFFPLLLFIGAYLAFGFLESEGARVGTGLGGLVLGFALVYLFGKGRRNDLPKVARVMTNSDFAPERLHRTSV